MRVLCVDVPWMCACWASFQELHCHDCGSKYASSCHCRGNCHCDDISIPFVSPPPPPQKKYNQTCSINSFQN